MYGNTVTEDLWAALAESSGKPVQEVGDCCPAFMPAFIIKYALFIILYYLSSIIYFIIYFIIYYLLLLFMALFIILYSDDEGMDLQQVRSY